MTVAVEREALLLPEGTRLVHIGPHKTGTTSLQAAFHASRGTVRAQGVRYAGAGSQPVLPVMAVTGHRQVIHGETPPPIGIWHDFVHEVERASEPRIVISSEFLCEADPAAVATIVNDLDPARVHVVITLRPLARILASQWQQWVQAGARTSFDDWLVAMFEGDEREKASMFWLRHRHDELIARWAGVAGTSNVTVVAVDDRDHAMVLRVFEGLTGLRAGTLATPVDRTNRSMTWAEVEVVRAFNELAFRERLSRPMMQKLMRYGAGNYMKQREPGSDELRIETPQWALDRAAGVAREMVDRIAASGVRVVGDLEAMTEGPRRSTAVDRAAAPVVPPEVAARAAVGIVIAGGLARRPDRSSGRNGDSSSDLVPDVTGRPPARSMPAGFHQVPTRQLTGTLVRRSKVAVMRTLYRTGLGR